MTAKKKHKKGDTIICAWCGEELVLSRGNQQFHKGCAKEKALIDTKERNKGYREKALSEKAKKAEMPRVSMLACKSVLAREKKLTYGQLQAQKYIQENNIGVKL